VEPAHYTDPLEEALSHGSQRVAQLASLAAAMAQVVIQRRALEQARRAVAGDERATKVNDDQERLLRRQARLRWAPAHDAHWLAQAGFNETARAWAGAAAYADTDPAAAAALRKCEGKLRALHPYAMARYDRLRSDRLSALDAMRETASLFARTPDARVGDPAPPRSALAAEASEDLRSVAGKAADERLEPDPEPTNCDLAELRGQHIIESIQARARAARRPELGSEELAMVLEAVTNLPGDVIDKLTRQAATEDRAHADPSPAELAAESFPITATDAIEAISAGRKGLTPAEGHQAVPATTERRGPAV
jgi:hypothetical protein